MPSVVIVGGGVSGLALAYRLRQAAPDADVTVLERNDRPGGTVWTEHLDGFRVEAGANGFLDTKPSTIALCRDLGLGDRLVAGSEAAARNRYLFLNGRLRLLPGSFGAFVRSDVLSWSGKLRLLAERVIPRQRSDGDESIAAFARRRAGREAAEALADAFVTGIYAGDPELLSLRSCFPRLAAFEEQYGSVMKGFARAARRRRADAAARGDACRRPGTMWSFREGLRLLVETLAARLKRPPLLGVQARRVEKQDRTGWVVAGQGGDRWPADAVVLTCPAYQQAAVLADLDRELADEVGAIPYNRVAVVALGYRRADVPRPLDGFGFLAPQRERRDLLGVQWCSSIYPDRAPADTVLLRAMCGGWHRPEVVGWDDARLLEAARAELRLALGIEAPPAFHHVVRWDRAIPQYLVGHQQRLARIEGRAARHAGLFLGGNAYRGVALNDCTEQAEVLAQRVAAYLAGGRPPG